MKPIQLLSVLLVFASSLVKSQTVETDKVDTIVRGIVLNAKDNQPLPNVNILNLVQVKGTVSGREGNFEIPARVNDSLYLSYIGFETITVRVTEDFLKFGDVKIIMTERSIALPDVVVNDLNLTGYLEIDARRAPIYNNRRYSINGLNLGYEAGDQEPGAPTKILESIFNPADFLFNAFGKKGKDMRKLREIKKEDEIRNLLKSKFDRETLMSLLNLDRVDIDAILRNCQYSKQFITQSNDLQILDAISECYEEYKILKSDSKKK